MRFNKQMALLLVLIFTLFPSLLCAQQESLRVEPDGSIILTTETDVLDLVQFLIPRGTIQAYGFSQAPEGWLVCDDREISATEEGGRYARLVALLRAEAADNSDHPYYSADPDSARLPNLRGKFLRGQDTRDVEETSDPDNQERTNAEGVAIGPELGSTQEDALQGFKMVIKNPRSNRYATLENDGPDHPDHADEDSIEDPGSSDINHSRNLYGDSSTLLDDGHGLPRVSSETRPANVYVNYIIKY